MGVRQKLGEISEMRDIGQGSACTGPDLENFVVRIPWVSYFGEGNPMTPKSNDGHCTIDMYQVRSKLQDVYRARYVVC